MDINELIIFLFCNSFFLIFSICLIVSIFNINRRYLIHCIIGYILRMILCIVKPYFGYFDDEIGSTGYIYFGKLHAQYFNQGDFLTVYHPWGYICGISEYLFGDIFNPIHALNCSLGVLTAILIFKVVLNISKNRKIALFSLLLALYYPGLVAMPASILKTQILAFALTLFVYGATLPAGKFAKRSFVLLVSAVMILIFRVPAGVLFIGITIIMLIVPILNAMSRDVLTRIAKIGIVISYTIIAFGIVYSSNIKGMAMATFRAHILETRHSGQENFTSINLEAHKKTKVSRFLEGDSFSLKNIIVLNIRSIYSPSPFALAVGGKAPLQIFQYIFYIIPQYVIFPGALVGSIYLYKNKLSYIVPLSCIIVFELATLSALTPAPETFRYRIWGYPILVVLFVFGLKMADDRKRVFYTKWWWISVMLFGIVFFSI